MKNETKTLCLPLKKTWFDMIKSGGKKEEYREITPYWIQRLLLVKDNEKYRKIQAKMAKKIYETYSSDLLCYAILAGNLNPINYKLVQFSLGYPSKSQSDRFMTKKIESISIGNPNPLWAPAEYQRKLMFIIRVS